MFNIDECLQGDLIPLDIAATLINNWRPDTQELLMKAVVQVPTKLSYKTNNKTNQRLLLVRNKEVEAEENTRTIKSEV